MTCLEQAEGYTIAVAREFDAHHYLVGGDWGDENLEHAHHYRVEVRLSGSSLDRHGYLVDIVDVDTAMDALTDHYLGSVLNDLDEFQRLNPSIEHLARLWCTQIIDRLPLVGLESVAVRVWESDIAWAEYRKALA